MKILFRTDAGGKVGLGHFYRSINLADRLTARGHQVFFTHRPSAFWNDAAAEGFGYPVFTLDAGDEETRLLNFLVSEKIDILFVDGVIEFSEEHIKKIKKQAGVVFYHNTGASRGLADVFILPAMHYPDEFFNSFTTETKVFKGLEYFMFHPKLYELEPKTRCDETVKSVAVIAGGSDPDDALGRISGLIDYPSFPEVEFSFYYGNNYMHPGKSDENLPFNAVFRPFNHEDILKSGILISAFGVSSYEFLYLRLPILSFGHQESNAIASDVLAEMTGALMSIGDIRNVTSQALNTAIKDLAGDAGKRQELVNRAGRLLDLKGPERVVEILERSL